MIKTIAAYIVTSQIIASILEDTGGGSGDGGFLLLEDGDFLLLEDGGYIETENYGE